MGEAKRRGTLEQRTAEAMERQRIEREEREEREARKMADAKARIAALAAMPPEQREAVQRKRNAVRQYRTAIAGLLGIALAGRLVPKKKETT